MNDKINLNYLENYAHSFAEHVSSEYFGTKKYMSGQEIIQLTPSTQVNFMVIKALFEKWNEELEKLKGNPYFDYRDIAVTEALKEFMNVLSRAIKIERQHFTPLLEVAVIDTVLLALDPLVYFWGEIEKSTSESPQSHLKASKKYLKWHSKLLNEILEKGSQNDAEHYKKVLGDSYQKLQGELEAPKTLLENVHQVLPIDWNQLILAEPDQEPTKAEDTPAEETGAVAEPPTPVENPAKDLFSPSQKPSTPYGTEKAIDPALAWASFEAEQSGLLKGPIDSLDQGVAINQRFMFTKKLFDGNPDLMGHAFKSIDQCDSFVEAVQLINERYVSRLAWDTDSDEVHEFLHLVYRKFDEK